MKLTRAIVLAALGSGALWAQQVYHVTDLGALTGASSTASGISVNGSYVTGYFQNGSVAHAFIYSSTGGAVDLGALVTNGSSFGVSVNNIGQVAGYASAGGNYHAFLYSGGVMNDLGTIGGGPSGSFAYGVNNLGQVVGYSNTSASNTGQYDAFLYSAGALQDLGLPPGGTSSFATGIDDSGAIAGYYYRDSVTTHAFTLISGVFKDLGTLNGAASGTNSSAVFVSSNGLVAGSSVRADGSTHAFLYANGNMVDLGTLDGGATSRAAAVNANGDVVGESSFSGSGFHGFVYSGGVMTDLNGFLDPTQTGFSITDAVGISDNGFICATGTVADGQTHALLLSPIGASPQTIAFHAIPNRIFGISPFPVSAQASSGLPVTLFSITPTVCKTSAHLVTLEGAGTCSITVSQAGNTTYQQAPPVTRSFTVSMAEPSGTMVAAAGSPFPAGTGPISLVAADFNGDGIPDLATANFESNNVTVLLGNGAGGFTSAPGSPIGAGSEPGALATGDFNGDGIPDLAVANVQSSNVTVLLGNGLGAFTEAPGSPYMVGAHPASVAVGDFNGDGIPDLVTASQAKNNVTVLLGNGSGGFAAASGSPFPVGTAPAAVVVGDFNRDGIQDLATANETDGTVTVLLGNGSGGFTPAPDSPFTVGSNPLSLVVGDFNGDGNQDLATANQLSSSVTVLLGNGSGGFTAVSGSPFTVGSSPQSITAGDFNGDGWQDLAVANYGSSSLTVLLGNGTGEFTAAAGNPFAAGSHPYSAAAGDFNGDGTVDLAAANLDSNNVTVLLGGKANTSSTLSTTSPLTIEAGQVAPLSLAVSDTATAFNAPTGTAIFLDGTTVLGTGSQTGPPYTFTANLAAGSHTVTAAYSGDARSLGSTSNGITVLVLSLCDVNRDGKTDVADVQRMVDEVLGLAPVADDLNGDRVVSILDVQIVINATLGLGCAAQ